MNANRLQPRPMRVVVTPMLATARRMGLVTVVAELESLCARWECRGR
jgi:hypothetical protein